MLVRDWLQEVGAQTLFTEPGCPWDNATAHSTEAVDMKAYFVLYLAFAPSHSLRWSGKITLPIRRLAESLLIGPVFARKYSREAIE
jgi:hypothetical protein